MLASQGVTHYHWPPRDLTLRVGTMWERILVGRLTAAQIKSLTTPGRHRADPTPCIVVQPSGSKSWVQRLVIDGRRRDIGLGGYPLSASRKRVQGRWRIAT